MGNVERGTRLGLALGLVLWVAALSGCDWTAFGYDAGHAGSNPTETLIGAGNVAGLEVDWSVPTGTNVAYEQSPAVSGDVVVTGTSVPLGDGTYGGTVRAVSAATGAELWVRDVGVAPEAPAIAHGLVYVGGGCYAAGSPSTLRAYDLHTGALRWEAPTAAPLCGPPAVAGDRVYVPTQRYPWDPGADQHLMALDAVTGREVWRAPVPSGMTGSPTVAGGVVVVSSHRQGVMAFDAASGAPRWTNPGSWYYTVASAYGRLYVGGTDGTLDALDPATGDRIWSVELASPGARARLVMGPAVSRGLVFAQVESLPSGRNGLVALDAATGAEHWFVGSNAFVTVSPVVANGVVYMPTGASIETYDAATGALVASLPYRTAAVIVANGHVYVHESAPPSETTTLTALSPPGGS
jgi:eukaryotic-like serine/threonine-protein kinase